MDNLIFILIAIISFALGFTIASRMMRERMEESIDALDDYYLKENQSLISKLHKMRLRRNEIVSFVDSSEFADLLHKFRHGDRANIKQNADRFRALKISLISKLNDYNEN